MSDGHATPDSLQARPELPGVCVLAGKPFGVRVVSCGQLERLLADIRAHPQRYPVVPINPNRARVLAGNPEARSDDPALLLVFADELCMGYLGLMPQSLATPGPPRQVLAFSTLFVHPSLRGKRVADLLLDTARQLAPLLTIGNSQAAQAFFRKRGLRALPPYRILYLPLGAGYLWARLVVALRKRLMARGLKSLAAAAERLGLVLGRALAWPRAWSCRRLARRLPVRTGCTSESREQVPDTAAALIRTPHGRVLWTVDSLNWVLRAADPGQAAEVTAPFQRYHFGHPDAMHAYSACLLHERGEMRGFALFEVHRIHDQATVSILFDCLPTPEWRGCVLRHALQLAVRHRADVLRAGEDYAGDFHALLGGRNMPERLRQSFACEQGADTVFDDYRESFADGDVALY